MSGWRVFKTYVIGNPSGSGKRPKEKVKGRDHIHDWDEVQNEECFGAILKSDFIDISYDSKEEYQKFLEMAKYNDWKCLALPSPHGGHSYWRYPKNHKVTGSADVKLACGFVADIHHGSTYIPLRVHGVDRFPADYDIGDDEEYQEVPEELWPVKTDINLWGMKDGDGRNDDLYKYILVLQKIKGIGKETIRRILTNTNNFIFDRPLDEDELKTILRDDAFGLPVFFDENNKFYHETLADYMIANYNVVKIDNQLHVYSDGVYMPDQEEIERTMIEIVPGLRHNQRMETLAALRLKANKMRKASSRYIAFENGIYDIVDRQMMDFTPDIAVTNKIHVNYDPEVESPIGDKALNDWACGDPSVRALLEECVGYCLYRENSLRKAFILTGGKRNGKSVFLDWVKATLGEENICALDLKELDDRFSTAMMYGKLANIGDDISDDFLQGTAVALFKKIVSGNRIKAEQKGKDPFEFNPYVKLLFSANEIPRIRDSSGAVMDRLIIIPFDATFEEGTPECDPTLKYKLYEEPQKMYLIRVAIEGLHRVIDREKFTESSRVTEQVRQYNKENNPLESFLEERDVEDIANHTTQEVYLSYKIYCEDSRMNAIGRNKFTRLVNTALGLETKKARVNGQVTSIFKRVNK